MADEPLSAQERTESPTPRRRQQAREEGRVARSPELSAAVVLLAGTAALASVAGTGLAEHVLRLFRDGAQALSAGPLTPAGATAWLRAVGFGLVLALLPFALILTATVVVANVLQTRGLVSGKPLVPDWSRVSPAAGLKRLASLEAPVSLLKSLLKLAALGLVTWMVLRRGWAELTALPQADPAAILAVLRSLVLRLALATGLAFLVVAGLDYGFQLFRYERSLRMTRDELVREQRETEGDPLIKSRIRSIARARARQRMLQAVPSADVVIVNPTHIAVALRYDAAVAPAPIVVAMGERKLAERIRALASRAGVPVVEDRPTARALLATGKVGQMIPPALYAAVAQILAWVYRQRGRLPGAGAAAAESRVP